MPINPQIYVPQIQPMQLQDPTALARNALAMKEAESTIAANQLKVNRANQLAGLIKGGTKPLTPQDLLSAGLFEEAESLSKAQNALTAGQKSSLDVVGAAMDTSARLLDTVRTPQEMMAWHEANHADPVLGAYLAARGITAEQSRAKIAEAAKDPVAFQQLILDARLGLKDSRKQHFIEQNYGGGTRVLAMPEYGGPAREVAGSDIKVTPSPNRPVTNITNVQERAEAGEYGKFLQKGYEEVRERANRGRRFLPNLELASKTLERGLETGFGAEFKKDAQRVLLGLGLSTDEAKANVENAELFQTVVKNQVLQRLADQKGPQTDQDALRAEQTIAGFDKSTDVNKFLIAFDKAVTKQDIAQEKFYRDWRTKNKTFDGAEDAWLSGPGNKSVFDDPALKKFAGGESNVPPPPPGMQINR